MLTGQEKKNQLVFLFFFFLKLNHLDSAASTTTTDQLAARKSWPQLNFWAILPVGIQSHVNVAVSPTYHGGTAVTATSLYPAIRYLHTSASKQGIYDSVVSS